MKKVIIAVLLVCGLIFLQNCGDNNKPTSPEPKIQWDAATAYEDGTPLANEVTVVYRVYIEKMGTDEKFLLLTTNDTQATLNLPEKGVAYFVGVSADDQCQESEIAWSYDPVYCKDQKSFNVIDSSFVQERS